MREEQVIEKEVNSRSLQTKWETGRFGRRFLKKGRFSEFRVFFLEKTRRIHKNHLDSRKSPIYVNPSFQEKTHKIQKKRPLCEPARESVFFCWVCRNSGKEKTHKHKQICGIVPGLGGCQNLVYVFFFGPFLMGKRKTHKQNSPQNPGTIPGKFCLRVLFFMCFFRSLATTPERLWGRGPEAHPVWKAGDFYAFFWGNPLFAFFSEEREWSASPKVSHKRVFTLVRWQPRSANTGFCSISAIF